MKNRKSKRSPPNPCKAKVVMVGDSGVGKTSILLRYDGQGFTRCMSQTLGASFISSKIRCNDQDVELNMWDTAGQERFRSMAPLYLRGANAAILTYDITRFETFRNLSVWMKELETHTPLGTSYFVMANKSDLEECRVISEEEGRQFAESINATYFETSAMNGRGIESSMRHIAEDMLNKSKELVERDSLKLDPSLEENDKERRFCCNVM